MNLYFSLSFIEQRNNDFIKRITKRGHGGPHNDLREKKNIYGTIIVMILLKDFTLHFVMFLDTLSHVFSWT